MRIALALAAALCASAALAATPQWAGGDKPFGVLLLGEGSDDSWRKTITDAQKELGKKFPVEFARGLAEPKEIQRAADALQRQHVRMIVAVPLFVSSFSEAMDQNRYLFGIRENPSKEFTGGRRGGPVARPKRVSTKVPVVMTRALDDHAVLVDILASRARALSKDLDPAKSVLVLLGEGPEGEAANKDWQDASQALAEKVRSLAGFSSAQAMSLREPERQTERERNQNGLRKRIIELRKQGHVVIVPLEMSRTMALSRLPRLLDGVTVKLDGKTILPDSRIARFIEESAETGAKLPDMRMFKDDAKGTKPSIAPPPSLHDLPKIDTRPSVDTKPRLGDTE